MNNIQHFSTSTLPHQPLLLPTTSTPLSNIQLPTQPLDRSEVCEFSANTLSSQPPPDVKSTLDSIGKKKPSTVSLLRGMRLKKNSHLNGEKCDGKDGTLVSGVVPTSDQEEGKKLFVRPFEDSYSCSNNAKGNIDVISEVIDTSYTPPEYKITENAILGNINVSIPVTLESNLKHINGKKAENDSSKVFNEDFNKNETAHKILYSSEVTNNNHIISSKQVSLFFQFLNMYRNLQ